jgi:hypothetical protein
LPTRGCAVRIYTQIRFLKEVPVGRKVYRPGDEVYAFAYRGAVWVEGPYLYPGRMLKDDQWEPAVSDEEWKKLLAEGQAHE